MSQAQIIPEEIAWAAGTAKRGVQLKKMASNLRFNSAHLRQVGAMQVAIGRHVSKGRLISQEYEYSWVGYKRFLIVSKQEYRTPEEVVQAVVDGKARILMGDEFFPGLAKKYGISLKVKLAFQQAKEKQSLEKALAERAAKQAEIAEIARLRKEQQSALEAKWLGQKSPKGWIVASVNKTVGGFILQGERGQWCEVPKE